MTDEDFRSVLRGLDEAKRYMAGEETGCIPHYFHLGVDAEDYATPTFSLSYSNFDYLEGLPDDELIAPESGVHLLEECPPELLVIDETDYGDE